MSAPERYLAADVSTRLFYTLLCCVQFLLTMMSSVVNRFTTITTGIRLFCTSQNFCKYIRVIRKVINFVVLDGKRILVEKFCNSIIFLPA